MRIPSTVLRAADLAALVPALVALPATALAAGGFEWKVHGFYIIDFLLFAGIIVYFVRKPLRSFLDNRRSELLSEIESARRLREEAAGKLADYERRLGELDAERARIVQGFVEAGERERDRILDEANRTADKIVTDAERRVVQESKRLIDLLEREAIELAVQMAETTVRQKMDAATQKKLVDESIQAIGTLKGRVDVAGH